MTVHRIDSETTPSGASAGDTLLLRDGDDVRVGRVTAGGTEWLGSVPADTLPMDGDEGALETAAQGVASALVERGG